MLRTLAWLVLISGITLADEILGQGNGASRTPWKEGKKCSECGRKKKRRYFSKRGLQTDDRCNECGRKVKDIHCPSNFTMEDIDPNIKKIHALSQHKELSLLDLLMAYKISESSGSEPKARRSRRSGKKLRKQARRRSKKQDSHFSDPVFVDVENDIKMEEPGKSHFDDLTVNTE